MRPIIPPPPRFTSSQELSFMLEALSHPCFPSFIPSVSPYLPSTSAAHLSRPFNFHSSLQSSLLPPQSLPRHKIVWGFLLSGQRQPTVWCLHHILAVAEDHLASTHILVAALQCSLGFSLRVTIISYNLYLDGCFFFAKCIQETAHSEKERKRERVCVCVSAAQS
jgi:hypothetical protein